MSRHRGIGTLMVLTACAIGANAEVSTDNPALPAADGWRMLSFEEKHGEMTFLVHPTIAGRFQEFYETAAADLTCRTCHGDDAEQHRYQMAYTPLGELKPSRVRRIYRSGAKLTREQGFKRDVITPLMARLLDVSEYDPATGLGFSCFGCHPREAE